MQKYIPLILIVVVTNTLSQLLLKRGMNTIGAFDFNGETLSRTLRVVAINPYILAGIALLVFGTALYLMVLSRVHLSFAYPLLSISYVLVLLAGYLWFGESLNVARVAGIGLICVGTFFVARS